MPFNDDPYLLALRDCDIDVDFDYDASDTLNVKVKGKGIMVCPCAISLEEVEVPFEIDEEAIVLNDELAVLEKEDACYLGEDDELSTFIAQFIMPLVPIKVVKEGKIDYPSGDGWKVMTEEELMQEKAETIDPRWEKLRELIDKEEE